MLGTLEDIISNILNRFPLNDTTNHIQKYLYLLTIVFHSVLERFRFVEKPDITQLIILSRFLQYYFKNYPIYQTLQSISKYITILSNYLSSLVPFHKVFDFQNSRKISPIVLICHFTDLTLYTKQQMDEHLGTLTFPITTTSKSTSNTINPNQSYKPVKYSLSNSTQGF